MALRKIDYTTKYGVTAEYWVLDAFTINSTFNYAEITVNGYVSKAVYDTKGSAIEVKKFKINWNDKAVILFSKKAKYKADQNIFTIGYEYLKTQEFFKDAIDV